MKNREDNSPKGDQSGWVKTSSRFVIVALLAAAIIAVLVGPTEEWVRESLEWIRGLGAAGGAAFVGIYVVATILFIPGSLLTLGAGFLFGLMWGTVVVSIGSTVGALIAFFVGRYLARDAVERRIEQMPKFQALMRALEGDALKVVFLVRLVPLFPFNVLNYAFGLTGISWRKYLVASWLGMLPGTIAYVWAGAAAETFVRAMSVEQAPGTATWLMWGVGGVALVSVVVFVTRRARAELEQIVAQNEPEQRDESGSVDP